MQGPSAFNYFLQAKPQVLEFCPGISKELGSEPLHTELKNLCLMAQNPEPGMSLAAWGFPRGS